LHGLDPGVPFLVTGTLHEKLLALCSNAHNELLLDIVRGYAGFGVLEGIFSVRIG
jgi:hypothetical protein